MSFTHKQQNDLAAVLAEFLPPNTLHCLIFGNIQDGGTLITNMPREHLYANLRSFLETGEFVRKASVVVQEKE